MMLSVEVLILFLIIPCICTERQLVLCIDFHIGNLAGFMHGLCWDFCGLLRISYGGYQIIYKYDFTTQPGSQNSATAFACCLHRAFATVRGGSPGSSQAFSGLET